MYVLFGTLYNNLDNITCTSKYICMFKDHPEFNLCSEGICVYKTDVLIVNLHLQGVNFLPRLHTDWFKCRVCQQSCVMCGIPLPSVLWYNKR